MLGLCMSQECRLSMRAELELATASVFPEVEEWLSKDKHSKAVQYLPKHGRKTFRWYRGTMDLIFCACFPSHEEHCRAFYRGKGPPLRDMSTAKQRKAMQAFILRMLKVAVLAHEAHEQKQWLEVADLRNLIASTVESRGGMDTAARTQ